MNPVPADRSKTLPLAQAFALMAAVALLDWKIDFNISFGFLYLFPVLILGTVFTAWQIVLVVLFCVILTDRFDPFPFSILVLPEDLLVATALLGGGLFTQQLTKRRRAETENAHRIESEALARLEAEEQLEILIDSSPAAIVRG